MIYEITSFRGGISDFEDKGIPGAFKFGSNLDIRRQVDSLSCKQDLAEEGLKAGSRSPSPSPSPSASPSVSPSLSESASISPTPSITPSASPSASISLSPSVTPSNSPSPSPSPSAALTSHFRDLIHFFVKSLTGYTYGFGNAGYIYRRDADGFWQQVYYSSEGAIVGAAEWYSDSGKTYLYWATESKLHRKELKGRDDWNDVDTDTDWPKQNLHPADWHTMREAGGSLIIANGPYLALVGYDDSYTNEALDLIPGNTAKTIVERNGRTIVGTIRTSDSKGINAAIDTEVPLAQVGDDGELFFANMVDSMPIKRFPGGGKCNPGGICNEVEQVNFFEWEQNALSWIDKQAVGNMALFAVYEADTGKGGIYSYGRKNKNHDFALNLDYQLDADELGAVVSVDGTVLVSYYDGTDYGVMGTDSTAKATGTYEGLDLKSKVKKPVAITNWKYAEVICKALPSGASIEFYYKLNKSDTWTQAKMEDGTTDFDDADETKAVFLIGEKASIIEPKIILNPTSNTSPEVLNIRIFFD